MFDVTKLHKKTWLSLQARRERLPHALLLYGQRGLGKFDLAAALAAGLLCEQKTDSGHACGRCLACGWVAQGNHPDFRLLQPEAFADTDAEGEESSRKASRQITIEQVRALDGFLSVGTHRAGLRVVLIHPAEAMNRPTANALLKSLEEPPPDTLFLLVSSEFSRLLPTIRSRCQSVPVPVPQTAQSMAILRADGIADPVPWLALAGGAPQLARQLATAGQQEWQKVLTGALGEGRQIDALAGAGRLEKLVKDSKGQLGLKQLVDWMQKWSIDLILARNQLPVRYFVRHEATISPIAQGVPESRLLAFYRGLLNNRRQAEQPLNARLFLEELLLNYRALFVK